VPRRLTPVALAATLALCAPAVAKAPRFTPGDYSGSGKDLTISFTATKHKAKDFDWTYSTFDKVCSNGQGLKETADDLRGAGIDVGPVPIHKRKFTWTHHYNGDVDTTWKVAGKLKGKHASGTYRVHVVGTDDYTCDSGKVRWTAELE
jgi:hypothetical protein